MNPSLVLMLITNNVEIAQEAEKAGVDRIFIDLERLGKQERQGHLNTHIADHKIGDIGAVKKVLHQADLLVRVNPLNPGSPKEIEEVVQQGADILMLPMFTGRAEVERFIELIRGRARSCLLLETPQAMVRLEDVLEVQGIDEIHIGLNDLHIGLKLGFMFELLSSGIVDFLACRIKAKGIKFGFGGVGKIGEGTLPAELIIKEHERIGSSMAILSRTFHQGASTLNELKGRINITEEVKRLRDVYAKAGQRSLAEKENDRLLVRRIVREIISSKYYQGVV